MNILIVDDMPEFKVSNAIECLKSKNWTFSYEIVKSVNSALRYIFKNSNEIDLIILDLGLPTMDDGYEYDKLNGLKIIDFMLLKAIKIPIIINSTTLLPNEKDFIEVYTDEGIIIEHVCSLDGEWLKQFIFNTIIKKQ